MISSSIAWKTSAGETRTNSVGVSFDWSFLLTRFNITLYTYLINQITNCDVVRIKF